MNFKTILSVSSFALGAAAYGAMVTTTTLPYGNNNKTAEGVTSVNLDLGTEESRVIGKSFYGADAHGFSPLSAPQQVLPLQLGYVKFGGNLHSTFNWQIDAYYDRDDKGIFYTSSLLEKRLNLVKQNYNASPMFEVNMLGIMPEQNADGQLVLSSNANAEHAANAISFLNGTKKLGLAHILMGNEPFNAEESHGRAIPSADEYIEKYLEYAVAVRSAQEKVSGNSNDIKLWGPEIATGWTGWQTTHPRDCVEDYNLPEKMRCSYGNGQFTEFMPYFLSRLAQFEKDPVKNPKKYKMIDVITWHYYPLFRKSFDDAKSIITDREGNQNVAGMLESVNVWNMENYRNKYDQASPLNVSPNMIKKFQDWKNKYYPAAQLAVTEFGIDSVDNIEYHPIVRPLYLADLIPRLGNGGVDTFINSFLQGGSQGSTWALLNGVNRTTLYYIYNLYSNFFKGSVLNVTDNFADKVNAYAVKNDEGVNVFFVNKDAIKHTSAVNFKRNGGEKEITNVDLAPWSLTVVSVPNDQTKKIVVRQYGAKEMGINID